MLSAIGLKKQFARNQTLGHLSAPFIKNLTHAFFCLCVYGVGGERGGERERKAKIGHLQSIN